MSGDGGPGKHLEQGGKRTRVLAAFHNHSELELPGENQWSLEQVIEDDPDYVRYVLSEECEQLHIMSEVGKSVYSTTSEIRITRDMDALNDSNILEATVSHDGILSGEYLKEKYIEAVNSHEVGYITSLETARVQELAKINIPSRFDQEQLEATVDAAVELLSTLVSLQNDLVSTANSFKTSPYKP
jgi:hypothetical protein